ncbi:hypothetical protein [Tenggerimyces flavus]|uniref:Uncharacterized protein n=1 Tax=Tenggerimyces flavus TaxID=1708749 RepID=A0ABV7YM06_9ACTN|nr:hypothetical protein [Tenggerimyces flavus]MBM7786569.1 hypothetical protein [Tenggerimyces flavus]
MAQPPRCYVCGFGLDDIPSGEDFRKHLTAVWFQKSPEEEEFERNRPYIPPLQQFTGHDPTKYFCPKHVRLALDRQHLYTADALAEIRELTASEPDAPRRRSRRRTPPTRTPPGS